MTVQDIQLREVTLNVMNLEQLTNYYQEAMGLALLEQTEDSVLLGVKATAFPLVRLQRTTKDLEAPTNGLYHLAIRVPSREALGNALYHWILTKTPIVGASNHGYSEAIYLEDPEGNGIEVYRDRPKEDWDIREDGRIVGITEEMDAAGVLAAARRKTLETPYEIPAGTDMGHVHLSVSNVELAKKIWMPVLNLDDKFSVPTGSWLAVGMYHHHFAFNQWAGTRLLKRQPGQRGLAVVHVAIWSDDDFAWVNEQAEKTAGVSVVEKDQTLVITDEFGLEFIIEKVK